MGTGRASRTDVFAANPATVERYRPDPSETETGPVVLENPRDAAGVGASRRDG